ncbi:phage tail fiber protein [Enterobacter hormaechei]|uniref:phage tail fiber domain-containing protein n=1 Tax=Enterobacter hormaechei TaxID=158836 RepID=UPI002044E7D7|nr:phage tail fiber protein [Enterobacter hormaechei]
MSVPNQTPYIIHNANGLTTVFPFEFYIINANDIQVTINGDVITSGYSVSGAGNVGGGDVVFLTPPASGSVVMLERVVPTYRLTDYQDNGDLLADTVNKDFDRLWMAIQRYGIHLGLALKRPLFGGPFDAEGYRISDLADPVNDQDAATKKYVESVSLARTLRVPENTVQAVPSVSMRANKLLAFNAAGDPIAVLPASGSASDVLIELAKPTGAGLSGTTSGGTVQSDLDKLNKQNDAFAYIEDYANLVVGDDWSDAIQEALDTGKDVVGEKDKIYTVSKVLNSKGQQLLGGFKLNITRYSLGVIPANSFVKQTPDTRIMMCYVSSAYDMAEMLYIKSLGFNIIHHYLGFANSVDSAGTTAQMLDNAQSAGLKVSIGTEQDPLAISDLPAFIASVDSHPAVYMYAVYDEPGARGISITDQDAKISVLRGVTTKTLQMVCQLPPGGPFTQWYSTNYDLVFVDSYSTATTGTLQQRIDQDLIKMRLDFGVIQQMTGVKRTIPCIGTFLFSGSNISGDIDQVVGGCKVFGTAGNGEFAAFVWDGEADPGITSRLRTNATLRKIIKDLASKVYYKYLDTKTYLFGGSGGDKHWPLQELLKDVMPADTSSSDPKITKNAWPTRIISGSGNGDHETTQTGVDVSGIAFKTSDAALCLSSSYSRGVGAWLEISNLNGGNPINGIFLMGKSVDGIRYEDIASVSLTSSQTFMFGFKPDDYSAIGTAPVIHFSFPAGTSPFYRAFMRGAIVFADW